MTKPIDEEMLDDLSNYVKEIEENCTKYDSEKNSFIKKLEAKYNKKEKTWYDWIEFLSKKMDDEITTVLSKKRKVAQIPKKLRTLHKERRTLEDFGPSLSQVSWGKRQFLKLCHQYLRQLNQNEPLFLSELASRGLIPSFFRLLGISEEIYSYRYFKLALIKITEAIDNKKPLESDFPLSAMIFSMFPDSLFWSRTIYDCTEFKSEASNSFDSDKRENAAHHFHCLTSLLSYIDSFALYHPLLYLKEKFYRDHLIHSIRVAWFMRKLFEKWNIYYYKSATHRLLTLLSNNNLKTTWRNRKFTKKDIESIVRSATHTGKTPYFTTGIRNATVAGLFHDVCLPIAEKEKAKIKPIVYSSHFNRLGVITVPSLDNSFTFTELRLAIRSHLSPRVRAKTIKSVVNNIIDCYKNHSSINNSYVQLFNENILDHGVLACLLLDQLPYEALQAISLHNLFSSKIEHKINLLEAPIAFFLILCDEAQEWGRLLASKDPSQYEVIVDDIDYEITSNRFYVKIDFSRNQTALANLNEKFDFFVMLSDKYKNLSRLEIPNGVAIDIEFEIVDEHGKSWIIKWFRNQRRWVVST